MRRLGKGRSWYRKEVEKGTRRSKGGGWRTCLGKRS